MIRKDSEKDPTVDPTALLAKVLVDQVSSKLCEKVISFCSWHLLLKASNNISNIFN